LREPHFGQRSLLSSLDNGNALPRVHTSVSISSSYRCPHSRLDFGPAPSGLPYLHRAVTRQLKENASPSHFPLHLWLQAIQLIVASKKGISTRQIQRTFNCSMKTAWFLTHRIREIMKPTKDGIGSPIGGEGKTIEADLTYVGRKPGTKVRSGLAHMNPVLALIERDGSARSFHMPNVRGSTLHAVIDSHASTKNHFMSDEEKAFIGIGWNFASHGTVKHSVDEYVRREGKRVITTNTVEGFFSILKRGVYGIYQHACEPHLHRYLAEFDFRYSHREKLGVNDVARASAALQGAKGRRLTYETTR
jgi:hypothetical protein